MKPQTRNTSRLRRAGIVLAAAVLALAGEASAQIGGLGLPGGAPPIGAPPIGGLTGGLGGALNGTLNQAQAALSPERLLDLRALRLQALVRANPVVLDVDDAGAPVVRSQIVALSPSAASLAIAQRAGFATASQTRLDEIGLEMVVLTAPEGLSTREAVRRLRRLDPAGAYDFNHLYEGAGAPTATAAVSVAAAGEARAAGPIGMVDTAVDTTHPALAGATIEQQAFAAGTSSAQTHGTAVASLIAGRAGSFRGGAPGASLYVADIYGAGPTGGASDGVVRALAWLSSRRVGVINMSLVGPANLAVGAAVKALSAKGIVIVAAVGNDGPAAPPMYPASYPEVVAVTAVDGRGRILPEAGRARHLDFAAPGADMAAAKPGGAFADVRGTSFAAPIVTGLLAVELAGAGRTRASALEAVAGRAKRGPGYGRGLVGAEIRTALAATR